MQTSDFFDKDTDIKEKQLIDSGSSTSITYKLSKEGRLYFMKQLRPEYASDPRYRSLFFKEYECGKAISHPYVVRYTDIGEDEEGLYIIMEYVNGISLKEMLLHEPTYFDKEENLYKLVLQLLEALQILHQQNVVYMDLSPTNILLTKASNDVKLIDLGFCISDTNDLTGGCTEGFAAPEARTTDRPQLDARTDIYALGCLLQYIEKKAKVRLPRLLQSIMLRCLQPEKEQRYQSVDEIIRHIKRRKVRRAAYMAGGLAVAIAAVVAFISSPLYTTLCDHMAWAMGSVPDRFEAKGVYYHITDHEARTVEVTFRGNTPDEYKYEYSNGRVYLPQTEDADGCLQGVLDAVPEQVSIDSDIVISFGDAQIRIFPAKMLGSGNDSCASVLFQRGKCDTLITGDLSSSAERELLDDYALPDLEVLIVGHHGSKYSTCAELLEATAPDTAIISVGADNPYGHPTDEVLERLKAAGCAVYRTDLHGTITYRG